MIFRCSGIQVFRHSGVPAFRCSGIPVFRHSFFYYMPTTPHYKQRIVKCLIPKLTKQYQNLRGWATGKYEYKGIGHTKVSGVYTKLHQPPPPHNEKINSLLYIYHIRDGYTRGVHPPSPGQGGAIFHDKAKKTK